MNKTTKASIATATGIVLLLGGGASLAYWTDSSNTGSGPQTIQAGTLTVAPVDAGQWTKGFYNAAGTQVTAPAVVAPGSVLLVPGNRLVYTQTFTVTAAGQDLYFTVGSTNGTKSATTLGGRLTSTFTVGTLGTSATTISASTTPGVYKVSAPSGSASSTITVTWTLDWPFGLAGSDTADNAAKGGNVVLTQGAITVTQVATP
jgi:alternate signal-mediated exported protein